MIALLAAGALVGGLLWVFKGGAILLGYEQPEYAFEVAPLLFALVTLGLVRWMPPSRARRIVTVLATTAVLSCLVAALSAAVSGSVLGPDLGIGVLTMTAALVVLGASLRHRGLALGDLPFLLGVGTIPAVLVGGALSMIDERLLEVPIVLIGLAWSLVGLTLVRQRPTPSNRFVTGAVMVLLSAVVAASGSGGGQPNLRTGVMPWALASFAIGVGVIVHASFRAEEGRPRRLAIAGVSLSVGGLAVTGLMLLAIGMSGAIGSDLLNSGETFLSTVGMLLASLSTLVVVPIGLLAFSAALLLDDNVDGVSRALPLVATLLFVAGPLLIALLPEAQERHVLSAWVLVVGIVWAAFALRAATRQLLFASLRSPATAGDTGAAGSTSHDGVSKPQPWK